VTVRPDQAASAYVGAFVDELARGGVRHACIAPGSRSTPLAMTIAAHPSLRTWMHLDERSAAFFALGLARASATPVVLVCTSGTAAANFLPAVVEANAAGVPLLVLTADRPPELRDVGAPQTIDQNRLFGSHAKWFVEVALPEASGEMLRYIRALACRATAATTAAPAGPVHLNFPFREPLVPAPVARPPGMRDAELLAWEGRPDGAPWVRVTDAPRVPDAEAVRRLAATLRTARRPLIVAGPQHDLSLASPLVELARTLDAPLLADPLSQLRWGAHDRSMIVDTYDAALRHAPTAAELGPDVVLRVGSVPASKPLQQFLLRHATAHHVVVDEERWPDPLLLAAEMVHAQPRAFAQQLGDESRDGGAVEPGWLSRWSRMNESTRCALADYVGALDEPFEGRALAEVAALVPAGGTLFVSSSMPVRDLDTFARGDDRVLRVLANRGANGIDGVVSSALGAAAAARVSGGGPLVLVIGDLALYHDLNGLLAARLHGLDATVVVLNNDGGGIFSFLPPSAHPAHFEQLFGTPHGLTFAPAAELHGAQYREAKSWPELRAAVSAGVAGHGLQLVEMRTDRVRNVTLHEQAWAAVSAALGRDLEETEVT
jgi:2-succinyl-5-enolpyruvyl-6-hydroxy-3-cyclohexene-1-carboxylate synthase